MAFRAEATQPTVKIVLKAETHEQLNAILLALHRALTAYDRWATRAETVSIAREGYC